MTDMIMIKLINNKKKKNEINVPYIIKLKDENFKFLKIPYKTNLALNLKNIKQYYWIISFDVKILRHIKENRELGKLIETEI